jgi:hypothetical protein
MNDQFNEPNADHDPVMPDRRKSLVAGLGLAAAPLLTHAATGAPSAETGGWGIPKRSLQPHSGCVPTASFVVGHAMVVDGGQTVP